MFIRMQAIAGGKMKSECESIRFTMPLQLILHYVYAKPCLTSLFFYHVIICIFPFFVYFQQAVFLSADDL